MVLGGIAWVHGKEAGYSSGSVYIIYIYMWYILFEYLVLISVPGNHASAKTGLLQHPTKLTTHSSLNSQL